MLNSILLQAGNGSGGGSFQILFFVAIAAIFYFFMIRPQQKKQKDQKKFIQEVKKGDQVVTIGGIHGKVISVNDMTIIMEFDRGAKITFEKSSVSLEASKKKKN